MKWFEKKIIMGCEEYSLNQSPYLIRWKLAGAFGYSLLLHKFVRSDGRDFHNHPWSYVSLVLKGSYVELSKKLDADGKPSPYQATITVRTPGDLKRYPATHLHRVLLYKAPDAEHLHKWCEIAEVDPQPTDKFIPCWTLVLHGPYTRQWEFWDTLKRQFVHWREYFESKGC